MTIIVDGTPYQVPKKEEITYAEVVTLAYPDYPQHPEITYSVTYTKGHGHKPEGVLTPGGSVKVKEGMAFLLIKLANYHNEGLSVTPRDKGYALRVDGLIWLVRDIPHR